MPGAKPTTTTLPPCLLNYDFSTDPSPMAITTAATPATGRINASASSGGSTVYCSEIVVLVPIGATATDLSTTPPAGSVNTGRWALADVAVVDGMSVHLAPGEFAQFTFDARDSSDYLIDYSLVVGLLATVNSVPGTFDYVVRETSGNAPGTMEARQTTFPLDKRPPQFYLDNLVATAPDAPTVPRTSFANGAPVRLSWQSNGTWFELFVPGVPTPVYAGPATTYTVAGGLARDTTFVLVAAVTGNPSGDTPSGGYTTIYLYDSLTLGVSDPDLVPRSVTASAAVTAATVTAGQLSAGQVSATTKATAADLGVTGTTTLKDLTATGTTTLAGTSVTGTLGVTKQATFAEATVGALLQATAASVSLMGAPYALPNRNAWYQAPTDGFVVGWCSNQGNDLGFSITATTGNVAVVATAARYIMCNPFTGVYANGSLILPVPKANRFSVNGPNDRQVAFWWVPLGQGNPVQVGEADEPEAGPQTGWRLLDEVARMVEEAEGEDADRLRRALAGLLDGAGTAAGTQR